ncbi:hypothetical protein [Bacteroides caecimuris]|uniref:hypothetical protein n=1 Tax=Bacteroides caecimuris TaxID=1796613 RepID=UPI002657DB03|nr:hypothetical protein [Bacteroides caecimuris]
MRFASGSLSPFRLRNFVHLYSFGFLGSEGKLFACLYQVRAVPVSFKISTPTGSILPEKLAPAIQTTF